MLMYDMLEASHLPWTTGRLVEEVIRLRHEAAEARRRALAYYAIADERGRRGTPEKAGACCDLGWIASEKALALEAEAARLEEIAGLGQLELRFKHPGLWIVRD